MRGTDADADSGTMRDDFEAALAAVGEETLNAPTDSAEASPTPAPEQQEEAAPTPQDAPQDAPQEVADASQEVAPASQESDNKDSLKAPVDWSPKEREDWSRIPRHLQDKIMQREKDIADNIANTKQARQVYDSVRDISTKYGSIMAAEGVNDPIQAINGLFDTVAGLRMGNQQDKATIVANMIQHYGVDIKTLDGLLSQRVGGGAPPQSPGSNSQQEAAIQRAIDERMAPVMQQMQHQQAQRQQAEQSAAQQQVQQFSQKAEFLNDVREDMADLIDLASKRGHQMSLEEAYNKACMANPEIVNIIAQRQRQADLQGSQQAIQQKQNAASSIIGRKAGTGNAADGSLSLRDQIAAAWSDAGN